MLGFTPISASLAVTVDGRRLARSRTNGFDYRSANNSVALINVPYKKGSRLVATYKRWLGETR